VVTTGGNNKTITKAGFPLGELVCANKQKANAIGW
jgi:hypothetical protein